MSALLAPRNGLPSSIEPPTPEESLNDARQRMARTFRRDEFVWIIAERYDEHAAAWLIDVLRQGAEGRWMRQRYRYDVVAGVLYFLGESAVDRQTFRELRRASTPFDVPAWQDR